MECEMVTIENKYYNIENQKLFNIVQEAQNHIRDFRFQLEKELEHESDEIRQENVFGIDMNIIEINLDSKIEEISHIDYSLGMSSFCIEEGTKFLAHSDMNSLVENIQDVSNIIPSFSYDHSVMDGILSSPICISIDCNIATPEMRQLTLLLGQYCNMVEASHYVSGHGKIWEPTIQITKEGNDEYEISFCSYQAGDSEEAPFRANLSDANKVIRERLNDVYDYLMQGTSNSNPLIMLMQKPDVNTTINRFLENQKNHPDPYENVFIYDNIFLPQYSDYTVEYSGYPYSRYGRQYATASVGNGYHPEAHEAIGYEKLF